MVAEDYTRIRGQLLALPGKLAPRLCVIEDQIETQEVLDQEIREVLEELSSPSP